MSKIRFNLKPIQYVARELRKEIANGVAGPAQDMLKQWGSRYLSFTKKRYYSMARGGWPRLAASTIKQRKRGSGRGSPTPLINKRFLVKGLQRGTPGNLFKYIPNGVRVGYSSSTRHPRAKGEKDTTTHPRAKGAQATFGNIAKWNEAGSGNLPKRVIFVDPDLQTIRGMQRDVTQAIASLGRQAQTTL